MNSQLCVPTEPLAAICPNYIHFGPLVGLHHRAGFRWQYSGYLKREHAEKIAEHIGMKPIDIWPNWYAGLNDLPDQRLPLKPLSDRYTSYNEMIAHLNRSHHVVRDWARNGIPLDDADKLCCQLGLHPSVVWADWFDLALAAAA